jgi:hypothetical protein
VLPDPRSRRQVHRILRRRVRDRGDRGDPHPDPRSEANAYAERFVGTARRECLDWILVLGRRHLERILRSYVAHYNRGKPHRGISLGVPDGTEPSMLGVSPLEVRRIDVLGGLIHEYEGAAA